MAVAEFKTSVLLIAMMGLAMFVVGMVLYAFAAKVSAFGYLLLPLPPIAVASYIYLNNWLVDNDVSSLQGAALVHKLWEVLIQTLVGGALFISTTFLILAGLMIWHAWTSNSG